MLSCFARFGLDFAVGSPSPAAWCSFGGSSEHAGTHSAIPSCTADLLWPLRDQVNGKNPFCLAWPVFPWLSRKQEKIFIFLSPHTTSALAILSVRGAMEMVTPSPSLARSLSPLFPQTRGILTVREIRVLSFLFNRTLWCYSKAHHRMSVWISLWSRLV